MTKFKEGTWIYDGGNTIHKVTLCSCDMEWTDKWKELRHRPTLEVVEKKVLLSEVEPKVGMMIRYQDHEPNPILVVGAEDVCLRNTDGRLGTIHYSIYGQYEVVSIPEDDKEPRLLTIEESLMPEHFGKVGKWLNRLGEEMSGQLDKTVGDPDYVLLYPVAVAGHTYTNKGRFYCNPHDSSDNDLSTFLGWEE